MERTKDEISVLVQYFEDNHYFRKQRNEGLEKRSLESLFRFMRFKSFKAGEKVFDCGDEGNLFYVIMEGEVLIKVPALRELNSD